MDRICISARVNFPVPLPSLPAHNPFHPMPSLLKGTSHLPYLLGSSLGKEPCLLLDPSSCLACNRQNRCVGRWLKFQQATFIPLYVSLYLLLFTPCLRMTRTILQCHFWIWEFDLESNESSFHLRLQSVCPAGESCSSPGENMTGFP